ncbi:trehalose 6-phosphate phosphatase [Propionibacterium cyclohexanicum]|uniref:Trehalose 6-phosphate phosphatase n=1 Tax=Propionibacterium cyclohexanicum TaxID=64702 RepID=A0A1H9U0R8_9ACTN|nr:trehalose-phosphatase [Propionibacterium cyclohexanicum]SES02693.1 trehalose 6-phosphate phosphatase [Propionibacterium cyclohexanicum]
MASLDLEQISDLVTFRTLAGRNATEQIVHRPGDALLCLDYDGTLAPIVPRPQDARPQPGVLEVLASLLPRLGSVAIVTGRPAQVVLDLGGFAALPDTRHLQIRGQYGQEIWDGATGHLEVPAPPPAIGRARVELEGLLAEAAHRDPVAAGVVVEDKGLALVVHTRRAAEPGAALELLAPQVRALADELGLAADLGRNVIELRADSIDKGDVVGALLDRERPQAMAFCGDDLGDLPAFAAIEAWQAQGRAGARVVSASEEVRELDEHADVLCQGPAGIVAWLRILDRATRAVGSSERGDAR